MQRREFISLLGCVAAAWPIAARAQQPERMRRIGLLSFYAENDAEGPRYIAKLLEALEQLGWAHGRNVQIDYRWAGADRDRFQRFATELVELKPDLIVGQSTHKHDRNGTGRPYQRRHGRSAIRAGSAVCRSHPQR